MEAKKGYILLQLMSTGLRFKGATFMAFVFDSVNDTAIFMLVTYVQ